MLLKVCHVLTTSPLLIVSHGSFLFIWRDSEMDETDADEHDEEEEVQVWASHIYCSNGPCVFAERTSYV